MPDSNAIASDHSVALALLAEFEQELVATRKFLERVPESQLTWRPHAKSMTAGQLALHIARIPGGVLRMTETDQAPVPDASAERPQPATVREVLGVLDQGCKYVRERLSAISDTRMHETFRIMGGEAALMTLPRVAFLRSIMLNHWYHHRGQLGVYLRLLGATVPSSYGPSGDEMPDFAK